MPCYSVEGGECFETRVGKLGFFFCRCLKVQFGYFVINFVKVIVCGRNVVSYSEVRK